MTPLELSAKWQAAAVTETPNVGPTDNLGLIKYAEQTPLSFTSQGQPNGTTTELAEYVRGPLASRANDPD
jgi:hypothetical protein